ncbi:MAG: hypothetical protein MMC33_003661 [Icmadophila ericetorum]|nr:hypothetical protein [Icmadophila ericetorum]
MSSIRSLRKYSMLLSFLCISLDASNHVLANQCNISPLSLSIANITLADGVTANRGMQSQIGGELLSLRLTTLLDNTRLRNARDCELGNASVASGCQGSSGSTFDLAKSPTWVAAAPGAFNVSVIDPFDPGESVIDGWDIVKFFPTSTFPGFPLEVWSSQTSANKSGLALGPQSSVLTFLYDVKLIPSYIFGLFYGSRSQLQGIDGNLTIGGYDAARVAGPWTNFSTTSQFLGNAACPLQVLISDIRLNNIEGSFSLLDETDSLVPACLDPLQNDFTLTESMYSNFLNVTRIPDPALSNETQITYPLSSEPLLGNLTIILWGGFEVTIPHYELVSQERGTTAEGAYDVINASALTVAISVLNEAGTTSVTGTPVLGGVYLSLVYLLVDYANEQFSLAPAVTGPLGDQNHDIIAICNSSVVVTTSTSASSSGPNTTAAIVGATMGVALLITMFVTFCLIRRRLNSNGNRIVEHVVQLTDSFQEHKEPEPVIQPQVAEKQGFRDVEEMEVVHPQGANRPGSSGIEPASPLIGEMDAERRRNELEGDVRRAH